MITRTSGSSPLKFHEGKILMKTAGNYPSVTLTLVECVQNGIDADAKHIFIGINEMRNTIVVLDDGVGATIDQMNSALSHIFESNKSKDKIGRFGIGVIAPINKCRRYDFTSKPSGERYPNRWRFAQAAIMSRRENIEIPRESLKEMPEVPKIFQPYANRLGIDWNTIVQMYDVTSNKAVSYVETADLEASIRNKLGVFMRQRGVHCQLVIARTDGTIESCDIKPQTYTGDPLPVSIREGQDAGKVVFELYRAPQHNGHRKGQVVVCEQDNPYGVTWHEFRTQALGLKWASYSEVFQVLGSGYFEGVIRCENLSLDPERTKFERTDALRDLYIVLDDWYRDEGQAHYEAEREQHRDERYLKLSQQVMGEVSKYLRDPSFKRLAAQLLDTVSFGRIGGGHTHEGLSLMGRDDRPSLRTGQGGAGVPRQPGSASPRPSGNSGGPTRKGDVPTGVIGKGNHVRALAKDDSIGLWIEIADLQTSGRLWEFDLATGKVQFNSRHPLWLELDGDFQKKRTVRYDKQIMNLQKWVILQILILLMQPIDEFEERRRYVDEQVRPLMAMEYFTK